MLTRKCTKCEEIKSVDEFLKGRGQCKLCRKTSHEERTALREGLEWECKECNQARLSSDFYEGRRVCKDCVSEDSKKRRVEDPDWAESIREQKRQSYENNPELIRRKSRENWAQTPRACAFCGEKKIQSEFVWSRQICESCFQSPVLKCKSCQNFKPRENYLADLKGSFLCRDCRTANAREWQSENPDRVKVAQRKHQSTPEYRAKTNQRNNEIYANSPEARERAQERNLIRIYRKTREEYELKKLEQGARCAICGCGGDLELDHNHTTDQVRDFLCHGCNSGIGQLQEDTQRLLSAINYLQRPEMSPLNVRPIPVDRLFARFEVPNWEAQSRDKEFRANKKQSLKRTRHITIDQYEGLLELGSGVCWICRCPEWRKKSGNKYPDSLQVDHNHATEMIRGLLCGGCNAGIGAFADDIDRLKGAIAYLAKWNGPTSEE